LFWLPLLPGSQALLPDPADGNGEARGCAEAGGRKKPGHVGISYGGSPVAGSFLLGALEPDFYDFPYIIILGMS
jgi:hypothetical protein